MTKMEQAKIMLRVNDIRKDLKDNPEKADKLIKLLEDNGFKDVSNLAKDLRRYL